MDRSRPSSDAEGFLAFPRTVWLLGWVSLATDSATEAIYPLLPFFLTQVLGAGAVSLGVVEGAAEAVNSLLKVWAGRASDRRATKRPLVLAGYAISSLARPLIAVATSWLHVLSIRVVDRVGKGIRSAPRDAMLAACTTPDTRGRVFGFHRAMDHSGAVLGPSLATLFLLAYPGQYRTLFALTIVPGIVAIGLILLVREDGSNPPASNLRPPTSALPPPVSAPSPDLNPRSSDLAPSVPLPRELTQFFVVLTLFTLGNSTDAFLLLKLTDVAGSAKYIPLIWAAHHVVKAGVSIVGGSWSDRIGRRRVIGLGWLVYAVVYLGFAVSNTLVPLLGWFFLYGCYFGFAEGTEKALVADLAPAAARGYAFGLYNAVVGVGAVLASVWFGLIWNQFGDAAAFGSGAALSLLATALLFAVVRR
ncbi:MAG: MFS transporter [Vicinamibacterales bacterium]